MQVEDYRHELAQGAGADLCPSRGMGEWGFPRQTPEQGLQPELGSKGTSHPSLSHLLVMRARQVPWDLVSRGTDNWLSQNLKPSKKKAKGRRGNSNLE